MHGKQGLGTAEHALRQAAAAAILLGALTATGCENHLEKAEAHTTLGRAAIDRGDPTTAEKELLAAVAAAEKLGKSHEALLPPLRVLAEVYVKIHDQDRAIEVLEREVSVVVERFGRTDPRISQPTFDLTILYGGTKRYSQALQTLERARPYFERLPADDQNLLEFRAALANAYFRLERFDEALAVTRAQGNKTYLMAIEVKIAQALAEKKAHDQATEAFKSACEIATKDLGPGHPSAYVPFEAFAAFLTEQKLYEDAYDLYGLAVRALEASEEPNVPKLVEVLEAYAAMIRKHQAETSLETGYHQGKEYTKKERLAEADAFEARAKQLRDQAKQ